MKLTEIQRFKMREMAWSWSRANLMESCPYAFYLQNIVKLKLPEEPVILQIGDTLSKGIEKFTLMYKSSGVKPEQIQWMPIISEFLDSWILPSDPEELANLESSKQFVLRCFWQFCSTFLPYDEDCTDREWKNIRIYPEFPVSFSEDGRVLSWFSYGVYFRLKIDFVSFFSVDDKFVCSLTDYKAGNKLVGVDQIRLYASVLDRLFNLNVSEYRGRILHLYSLQEEKEIFSLENIRQFWNSFYNRLKEYSQRTELPPIPEYGKCEKCSFRRACKFSAYTPPNNEVPPSTPSGAVHGVSQSAIAV